MSGEFALQSFGGHRPMFAGQAEPSLVPDFNAGLLGGDPLMAMLANAGMAQAMGAAGMVPSQFAPTQNFFDQVMAKDYFAQRGLAGAGAAAADRSTYESIYRGIARMAGRPATLQDARAASTFAGGVAALAPFLAQAMPEMFDALHGSRGSATVMAMGLHRGGRLAQDAATGLTGMSGASAGAVAGEVHRRFFGEGADVAAFKGLSMGRLGLLYEDVQARGLAGPSIASLGAGDQAAAMARGDFFATQLDALKGRNPDLHGRVLAATAGGAGARGGLDALRQAAPDEWDNLKRNFDARKIGDRLQNLSGAVSAMRDIFGDMGKPNAPMRELVEGLNQLTQGGLATMAPGQLEKSVRMTQALARSTGMGMDGAHALGAQGASIADRVGVERAFVPGATQGAMAFGAAFGQVGRGDVAHFQATDKEQLTLMDQRLRLQAAKSGLANQLNTALRLADSADEQGAPLGGRARELVDALKAGRTTFGKDNQSVFMDEGAFRDLMTGSGVREGDLVRVAQQSSTNRQWGAKYGTDSLVRQSQSESIRGFIAQSQRASIRDLLTANGLVGAADAERVALTAGNAAAGALLTMDAGDRRNDGTRDRLVGQAIKASLSAQNVDTGGISDAQAAGLAGQGFGAFNEFVQRDPRTRGLRNGLTAIELNDRNTLARQRAVSEEARISGAMRSAMAAIGQAGPLARLSDAVQAPQAGLGGFVARVMGGQDPDKIRDALNAARGDVGKLADGDRMNLMAAGFVRALQAGEDAKRIADPDARNAALGAALGDVEALQAGGGKARARIDATLAAAGLAPGDLQAAIAGTKGNLTADERDRLQRMSVAVGGGILATAEKQGIAVGARFGAKDAAGIAAAGGRIDAGMAGLRGLKGDALAKARAEVARHGGTFAAAAGDAIAGLLASPGSIERLGKGGLALADRLRSSELQLQHLADRKAGGDVGKLLASGDAEADHLRRALEGDLGAAARRQDGRPAAMDAAEKKAVAGRHRDLAGDDATKNKAAISALLREAGAGAGVDAGELEKMLGSGREGDVNREWLGRGLAARKAGRHDAASIGSLSRLDEGNSQKILRDALEDVKVQRAAGGDSPGAGGGPGGGGGGATRITGRVRIENGEMLFTDVRGEPAGAGSTPISPMS